jgi:ArsR family transcriptional regulator
MVAMEFPGSIEPCCAPLLAVALTGEDAARMAAIFRVLAEPARLQLLSAIARQPNREVRACQLVETLGLSQPTVSHHLKVMYEAGLLGKERRGNWIYYRAIPERILALQAIFSETDR